jgi:succinyl-diaminopimelate desuccinylase
MTTIRDRVVGLTSELVKRAKTDGYDDGGQELLAERLTDLGFIVERVPLSHSNNLLALRGAGPEYFAFSGHTDVVVAGDGWSVDPFQGTVVGDRLLGRGVADMKGSVAAWMVALEDFLSSHPNNRLPLALLIAGDEEVQSEGTPALLERLASQGKKIAYCLVGEPTGNTKLGDCIKIGRRGSLSAKVSVRGVQGHVAYPHLAKNTVHAAVRIINKLTAFDVDAGLAHNATSDNDLGWPPSSLQISSFNAGTGAGTNVVPGQAEFKFNIRFRSPLTREALIGQLTPLLQDSEVSVEVVWTQGSKPYDSKNGELRELAYSTLRERGHSPVFTRDGGTSDGRFIAECGAEVVELGPSNATIHKIDEGLEIAELVELVEIYGSILTRLASRFS